MFLGSQRERMAKISTMILAGCGTSLNASMYGAKLMREYEAFDAAMAMDAAEIRPTDIPTKNGGIRVPKFHSSNLKFQRRYLKFDDHEIVKFTLAN